MLLPHRRNQPPSLHPQMPWIIHPKTKQKPTGENSGGFLRVRRKITCQPVWFWCVVLPSRSSPPRRGAVGLCECDCAWAGSSVRIGRVGWWRCDDGLSPLSSTTLLSVPSGHLFGPCATRSSVRTVVLNFSDSSVVYRLKHYKFIKFNQNNIFFKYNSILLLPIPLLYSQLKKLF